MYFMRVTENKAGTSVPWAAGSFPLMLAPMQGITNRALRGLFIERYRPDVVFTEFVRVQKSARKSISETDRREVTGSNDGVPLVVQLIGSDTEALVAASDMVQELGARHLNINLGCPYGRMSGNSAGGALLKDPTRLPDMLTRLRQNIKGTFSVKTRAGFDDPSQLLSLLPLFEDCGVDFLIVHPRTVRQRYSGLADHSVTAEVVRRTSMPVIANGDIFSEADGRRILDLTDAAGLMLGRGAIADPFLFERIRKRHPAVSDLQTRGAELQTYLKELLRRYERLFQGEHQILCKMKAVLSQINDSDFTKPLRRLKRSGKLAQFVEVLDGFANSDTAPT